jgi:hypothetical protein
MVPVQAQAVWGLLLKLSDELVQLLTGQTQQVRGILGSCVMWQHGSWEAYWIDRSAAAAEW